MRWQGPTTKWWGCLYFPWLPSISGWPLQYVWDILKKSGILLFCTEVLMELFPNRNLIRCRDKILKKILLSVHNKKYSLIYLCLWSFLLWGSTYPLQISTALQLFSFTISSLGSSKETGEDSDSICKHFMELWSGLDQRLIKLPSLPPSFLSSLIHLSQIQSLANDEF